MRFARTKYLFNHFFILLQGFSARLYQRVFHEEMTAGAKAFLKSLLYIMVGTSISTLLSYIFTILGGRLLGPDEYGKFVLIQSVAMFLYLPMLLGFNVGILKYTSEKQDVARQSNIIATSYLFVSLLTALSTIIYLLLASPLSRLFDISLDLFYFAIAFAGLFVFYNLTTSALRGLNQMRLYSVFQVLYGGILLISFLLFLINNHLSLMAMIYPLFIAYGITTIIIFAQLIRRRFFKWKPDMTLAKVLVKYAVVSVVGALSYVLYTNIDRIMIMRYLSLSDVGVYGAYYTASINVAMLFWGMFNLVFFPTVSGYKNKGPVYKKINKFMPFLVGLGLPLLLIFEFITLKLYGQQYQVNILWMVLFAVTAICMIIQGNYAWLLNSVGTSGAKIASLTAAVAAVVNIGLNIVLIPAFGISGAIISLMATYLTAIAVVLVFGRKYFAGNVYIATEDSAVA